MSDDLAFIGDVHGKLAAVQGLLAAIREAGSPQLVFLGDYLNKGPSSAEVLQLLIELQATDGATLLAGNHETALLTAVDSNDITTFLKMGGSATIRSYVKRAVQPDVMNDFRSHIPPPHLAALREMPAVWSSHEVVAQHVPSQSLDQRYRISAHRPVGPRPRISEKSAEIDTGCGDGGANGRLTAFYWPSRTYVQVDELGHVI